MAYNIEARLHVLQSGGERVTSGFGPRTLYIGGKTVQNNHLGIDLIQRAAGTDYIVAAQRGVVTATRNSITGYSETYASGNYVKLAHAGGFATEYLHMKTGSVCVSVGQRVEKGQILGFMGTTGWSTGNHVHFGVRVSGTAVDPRPYLLGEKEIDGEGGELPVMEGQITLTGAPLYAASTSASPAGTLNGIYYIWSPAQLCGRVRVTNSAENIGKTGQVTGWVNVADIPQTQPPASDGGTVPSEEPQPGETDGEIDAYRAAIGKIREIISQL